jgi:hypothetical protein
MNVEETIKHLGNHWDLYKLAAYEECSFDYAKRYLMDDCGKPESTARAKMGAFRYSRDSLLSISDDGKCYSIDHDKVDELEMLLDEVIHFTEFDYRYRKLKEYAELCDSQAQDITDWMDMYESLRERLETTKQQLKDENEEIRRKHAKTVAGIADKVEGLATDCDKRLQELEQRDCLAKGMSFIERIKIFFQMKLGLIPISEYRQMELEIFKVSDELKELKRNI